MLARSTPATNAVALPLMVSSPSQSWPTFQTPQNSSKRAGSELKQNPGFVGPYRLQVHAVRPDARRRDLDNFAFRAVSDILVSLGVVSDDSDCVELSAKWITDGDDGVVHIEQI